MKHFLTFLTFLSFSIGIAQNKNEQLYQSVVKNDKAQVEQLLSEKADANYIQSSGWVSVNVLITAVNNQNLDIVQLLVANKADVNWKDGFKTTALMYAAATGNLEISKYLIENGADIKAKDEDGNTVLSAAKESENEVLIDYITSRLKD